MVIKTLWCQLQHVPNAVMHGIHDVFPPTLGKEDNLISLNKIMEGRWVVCPPKRSSGICIQWITEPQNHATWGTQEGLPVGHAEIRAVGQRQHTKLELYFKISSPSCTKCNTHLQQSQMGKASSPCLTTSSGYSHHWSTYTETEHWLKQSWIATCYYSNEQKLPHVAWN